MDEMLPWLQFGIAGAFLGLLFFGLRSGALYTGPAVQRLMELQESRIKDKNETIATLKEINEKLDKRNDILSTRIGSVLEVSKAQGMIEALPPLAGERVIR